jgi:DNA-binding transcriptional regulator YiaG/ribosomal protein S14
MGSSKKDELGAHMHKPRKRTYRLDQPPEQQEKMIAVHLARTSMEDKGGEAGEDANVWDSIGIQRYLEDNRFEVQQLAHMIGAKSHQIQDWISGWTKPSRRMLERLDALVLPEAWSPARIKALRNKTGLTMYGFAWEVGVAPFTMGAWESGKQDASPANCLRLSKVERQINGRDFIWEGLSPSERRNRDIVRRCEETGNASLVSREFGVSRERVRQIMLRFAATGKL